MGAGVRLSRFGPDKNPDRARETTLAPISIAIIGLGKIAQDQHLPVIGGDPDFSLAAVVSGRGLAHPGVPTYGTPGELFAALPGLEAVAICTPPSVRHAIARAALEAGVDVMLEKPPTPTVAELLDLEAYAAARGRVIFTTWHSQYNAAVDAARARLAGRRIRGLHIDWREDVRRWHPGQAWIWEVGGFGVFDPGINALSILTRIFPGPVFVRDAELTYPSNRAMPIAARLTFGSPLADGALTAEFDWRKTGDQSWTIEIETAEGERLRLTDGGSRLAVAGVETVAQPMREYEGLYRRFAALVRDRASVVDTAPFQLVADAFMVGRREVTDAFAD